MTVKDHYNKLGEQTKEILTKSLSNNDLGLLSSNHAFLHDLAIWLDVLKDRPEISILSNAVKEYQMAILSNNLGLYQQAFMGLRFFFERTLVAVLFSANEIELNLWRIGDRDTYWNELMDENKGLFSFKFCRAFFPELKDEISHFAAIAKKVYRECSEYVHGNQTVLKKIPTALQYSEEVFYEWNSKADIIRRVLLFIFCLRYLKQMKSDDVKKVESSISEDFKSIKPIVNIINS